MSAINLYQLMHGLFRGNNTPYYNRIIIPKIQRDYAEGRESESVEKKRTLLLQDMLDVVFGHKNELSLDFVYGTTDVLTRAIKPLDGQQRLTTLFLLHWLMGRNNDLKDEEDHSLFVYETRKTSEEFCHWLVNQDASRIICDWEQSVCNAETLNENNMLLWSTVKNSSGVVDKIANRLKYPLVHVPSLFDHFMGLDEFKWEWHIDPNIHSMIAVLETCCHLMDKKIGKCGWCLKSNTSANQLDRITFELLDNLDCDGDELFEKMNARGKALTSFDLLKSSLEEEMELQQSSVISQWENAIDNDWINYCWDNSSIPENPTLDDVVDVEKKLERMLVRVIGKSFFNVTINNTPSVRSGVENPGEVLIGSVFKDCNKVVDNYFKYVRYERSCGNACFTKFGFQEIYDDVNNMLYTEKLVSGKVVWRDISWYLHNQGLRMHADNNNTLLDDYMADSPNHDTRVIFYGMMAYLKRVNAKTIAGYVNGNTIVSGNQIEFENFKEWMRFLRNVFMAANKNARIDNSDRVKEAVTAIDSWLDVYFASYHKGLDDKEMLVFIPKYVNMHAEKQEQARLDEEALKANLRIGTVGLTSSSAKDWSDAIIKAEENPYLWGQIIAPLFWSFNNGLYDLNEFNKYIEKLDELFSASSLAPANIETTSMLLIQAVLSVQDYRFNGNVTWGSLGTLNDDRDVSWKRHLREQINGNYGVLIRSLIEEWMKPYATAMTYSVFLTQIINNNKLGIAINDWRHFIINLTTSELASLFGIAPTSFRYINEANGCIYVYRSKTPRSDAVRYELVTMYLYVKLSGYKRIEHVNGVGGPCVEFDIGGNKIRIASLMNGYYDIIQNGTVIHPHNNINNLEINLKSLGLITSL